MEEKKVESAEQPQSVGLTKPKSKFKLWVDGLDIDKLQTYFLYFLIIVQAIAVQTALHDAAFYCENYCTASDLAFSSYSNGDCRCVVNQTVQNNFNLINISWNPIEISNNSAAYEPN